MMSIINQRRKNGKLLCIHEKCCTIASFNILSEKNGLYCSSHKMEGMENVRGKKCAFKACKIGPIYNIEGEFAKYCSAHKTEGMIDVTKKKCIFKDCKTRPIFNLPDSKKGLYCSTHKSEDMVDVINKKCIFKGCTILPTFNYEECKNRLYCKKHKLKNMISLNDVKCIEENCTTNCSYNYANEEKALYCFAHKLDGMVNINAKICEYEKCCVQAMFNYKDKGTGKFCFEHKEDGMINLAQKLCEFEGCDISAIFNIENESRGKYCVNHKFDNMVDVVSTTCLTPLCDKHPSNKNYEGYCIRCFMYTFPDKPVVRNYKTKERAVVEYVYEQYPLEKYTWINDKTIQDGCSYKRPDLFIDLGYQVLIVEVDENAHQQYDTLCDHRRTMELSKDVDHKPIIFIRLNPDKYTNNKGEKIPSCWKVNGNGICVIDKKVEWQKRLEILNKNIEYWLQPNNISTKTITNINLFFND